MSASFVVGPDAPPVAPERSFRSAGCGPGCRVVSALRAGVFGRSDLLLHDPGAHEAYGRHQAGGSDSAVVRTGRLSIDMANVTVLVGGRAVIPTPTEARVLFALAQRLGSLVPHAELAVAVWGLGILEEPETSWRHSVRVNMVRLRRRLYPLSGLISTVPNFGYRLERLAADAPVPVASDNYFLRSERWSREYDACRACGLTDLPHDAQGYCSSCYETRAVRLGRGRSASQYALAARATLRTPREEP